MKIYCFPGVCGLAFRLLVQKHCILNVCIIVSHFKISVWKEAGYKNKLSKNFENASNPRLPITRPPRALPYLSERQLADPGTEGPARRLPCSHLLGGKTQLAFDKGCPCLPVAMLTLTSQPGSVESEVLYDSGEVF